MCMISKKKNLCTDFNIYLCLVSISFYAFFQVPLHVCWADPVSWFRLKAAQEDTHRGGVRVDYICGSGHVDVETPWAWLGFWKRTQSTSLLAFVLRTGLIYEVKTNFTLGSDSGVQMRRHNCLWAINTALLTKANSLFSQTSFAMKESWGASNWGVMFNNNNKIHVLKGSTLVVMSYSD